MVNISRQGHNLIFYAKLEATLGSTNKDIFVCDIPTQLGYTQVYIGDEASLRSSPMRTCS